MTSLLNCQQIAKEQGTNVEKIALHPYGAAISLPVPIAREEPRRFLRKHHVVAYEKILKLAAAVG